MERLRFRITSIPTDIDVPCEMPARTGGTVPCDFNAELELQTTNDRHIISTCLPHFLAGYSIAHDSIRKRLAQNLIHTERGEIENPKVGVKRIA